MNLFKRYFEKYYTTDLEQYKFDKTECKACVHNAANYNLFAEHNGCGHCTNRKCLEAKNAAHVAKETEKLLKSDPKLVVARPYYGSRNDMALQKLDKKGHEIKELDYNVSAREFPKAPEAPKKEQFTQTKEYEQAVQTFERRNEEYARKVEELDRMKEEGRIKTYVKVGQTEPELCYVEINRKETAPSLSGHCRKGTSVSNSFPSKRPLPIRKRLSVRTTIPKARSRSTKTVWSILPCLPNFKGDISRFSASRTSLSHWTRNSG